MLQGQQVICDIKAVTPQKSGILRGDFDRERNRGQRSLRVVLTGKRQMQIILSMA